MIVMVKKIVNSSKQVYMTGVCKKKTTNGLLRKKIKSLTKLGLFDLKTRMY